MYDSSAERPRGRAVEVGECRTYSLEGMVLAHSYTIRLEHHVCLLLGLFRHKDKVHIVILDGEHVYDEHSWTRTQGRATM
jgi:hypothetical protein